MSFNIAGIAKVKIAANRVANLVTNPLYKKNSGKTRFLQFAKRNQRQGWKVRLDRGEVYRNGVTYKYGYLRTALVNDGASRLNKELAPYGAVLEVTELLEKLALNSASIHSFNAVETARLLAKKFEMSFSDALFFVKQHEIFQLYDIR